MRFSKDVHPGMLAVMSLVRVPAMTRHHATQNTYSPGMSLARDCPSPSFSTSLAITLVLVLILVDA